MKERIHWIDISKGIAIILVVIGHVISSYHQAGLYNDSHLFNFTTQFIYSFHMPLFMIISGYLSGLRKPKGTKIQQIIQYLINYGIPYIIFSVVWVLMKMIMANYTNTKSSVFELFEIMWFPVSFMWFIFALMIMQIIQVIVSSSNKIFKLIHLLIALAGYFVRPFLVSWFKNLRFSDCILNDFLRTYVFYLIGIYVTEFVIKILDNYKIPITIISGVLLISENVLVYFYTDLLNSTYLYFVLSFVFALVGCLFVIYLSKIIKHFNILEYLGKQSLPIYVLQGLAIAVTRLLLTKLNLNVAWGILPLVVCTIAGCLIPLCVYWITKKIWKLELCFYPQKYIRIISSDVKDKKTILNSSSGKSIASKNKNEK